MTFVAWGVAESTTVGVRRCYAVAFIDSEENDTFPLQLSILNIFLFFNKITICKIVVPIDLVRHRPVTDLSGISR